MWLSRARLVTPILVLPAVLAALAFGRAAAITTEAPWEESAGLRVQVDDTVDAGARIYDSPDYQKTLVVPEAGDQAWVFFLKAQSVQTLPKSAIQWNEQKLPVVDLSSGQDAGGFVKQDGAMLFVGGEGTVKLEPEPPLIGRIPTADLSAKKPDYAFAAKQYTPDAKAIETLKAVKGDTRIVAFFGSWCSHCKHWVPGLLKTLEASGNAKLTPEFYGISEDMAEPGAELKQYGVTKTPTFIVIQGGKELGRIEEEPTTTVEGDLARLLANR